MKTAAHEDMDPEERRAARAEEEAFRDSDALEWRGSRAAADALQLEPFSFVRKTAAIALGMSYGSISNDDIRVFPNPEYIRKTALERELEQTKARAKKKGAKNPDLVSRQREIQKELETLKDEPEEMTTYDGLLMDAAIVLWLCLQPDSVCQRARRKPREYESKIDRWAEEEGIAGASMSEATGLFAKIMAMEAVSKVTPKVEDKSGGN